MLWTDDNVSMMLVLNEKRTTEVNAADSEFSIVQRLVFLSGPGRLTLGHHTVYLDHTDPDPVIQDPAAPGPCTELTFSAERCPLQDRAGAGLCVCVGGYTGADRAFQSCFLRTD